MTTLKNLRKEGFFFLYYLGNKNCNTQSHISKLSLEKTDSLMKFFCDNFIVISQNSLKLRKFFLRQVAFDSVLILFMAFMEVSRQ